MENVEVVRRLIEDANARDIEAAMDVHADEVVVSFHGEMRAMWGQDLDTKEAVMKFMADWYGAFDQHRFEVAELRDLGERVLVVLTHHAVGRSSGTPISQQQAWIYTLREGKVVRSDVYPDAGAALRALGLLE
jgi:ketosteroid isomerase-like protein